MHCDLNRSYCYCCARSPAKSSRKPQKRHYNTEDDDGDDSSDFQPSPSVRRKLAHSFSNSTVTRYIRNIIHYGKVIINNINIVSNHLSKKWVIPDNKKQLPAKGHMTPSQAPAVCEKNIFHLFCFTQPVENNTAV